MNTIDACSKSLMNVTNRPPILFTHGKGSWLWDSSGKKYLDFVQGWAVNCLGHCPQCITDALTTQSQRLITPSPAFYNEPSLMLAARIIENSCFDQVFFTNCGAEAKEGAIKLARKWGSRFKHGAYKIITFENSFHGRTLATMSASGKPQFKDLFEPKVPGFPKAKLNDLDSVKKLIADDVVAIMLEPVQGEAGVIQAEDSFLQDLRALTNQQNLLLIVDEIQTGVGRTGTLWGYQQAGVEPDIMTLGKMLGGGVPLAALVAKNHVVCFDYGDQGGTFNGNPLMTAVGLEVLEQVLATGFLDTVVSMGQLLKEKLQNLSGTYSLGEVRGRGLLVALDLGRDVGEAVVTEARDAGLLLNAPRPHLLRFMPALNVTEAEIDSMLTILTAVLHKLL